MVSSLTLVNVRRAERKKTVKKLKNEDKQISDKVGEIKLHIAGYEVLVLGRASSIILPSNA